MMRIVPTVRQASDLSRLSTTGLRPRSARRPNWLPDSPSTLSRLSSFWLCLRNWTGRVLVRRRHGALGGCALDPCALPRRVGAWPVTRYPAEYFGPERPRALQLAQHADAGG